MYTILSKAVREVNAARKHSFWFILRLCGRLQGQIIAKFHYTGPTGPDRTGPDQTKSADFVGDPGLVVSGPVGEAII